jgi:hypothetical protein
MILAQTSPLWAGQAAADPAASYRQALAEARSAEERARLHRELGDLYERQDDLSRAAAEYLQALTLSRSFSEDERLRMAVRISWADRLPEAERELRALVADNPGNVAARVHLARVLAWRGEQSAAISEADMVLSVQPHNRDALQVKADALRWSGHVPEATLIYLRLLAQQDDFAARLGLASAQLEEGDSAGARETAALLTPRRPHQERELARFRERLAQATAQTVEVRYLYSEDTDSNRANRVSVIYRKRLGRYDLGARYSHTEAWDPARTRGADEFGAWGYTRLAGRFGLGAGAGLARMDDNVYPTGYLKGDAPLWGGTLGMGLAREALTETAQLIDNGIRVTVVSLAYERNLAERLTVAGGYGFRDYSDDNQAQTVSLTASYLLIPREPALRLGYRFRWMNYDRQSFGGYFDPNDFVSNQLFASLAYERWGISGFLSGYGGYQSFRRYGAADDGFVGGIAWNLGYRFTPWLRGETDGELGNSALGTATGYTYFQAGARLLFTF